MQLNLFARLFSVPASTQEQVPMLPGMITSCPAFNKDSRNSSKPGLKTLVAPFRCTMSFFTSPLTRWSSSLQILCAMSYSSLREPPSSSKTWAQAPGAGTDENCHMPGGKRVCIRYVMVKDLFEVADIRNDSIKLIEILFSRPAKE